MAVKPKPLSPRIALSISIVSVACSIAAVCFSAAAWRGSVEATRIANSAQIDFDIDPDSDDPLVGFAIRNAGHGTAVHGSVQS